LVWCLRRSRVLRRQRQREDCLRSPRALDSRASLRSSLTRCARSLWCLRRRASLSALALRVRQEHGLFRWRCVPALPRVARASLLAAAAARGGAERPTLLGHALPARGLRRVASPVSRMGARWRLCRRPAVSTRARDETRGSRELRSLVIPRERSSLVARESSIRSLPKITDFRRQRTE
jgi:hypothetical protein